MQDFIKSAASKLGLDESVTKNATGTALGFIKKSLGDQFSSISARLPGAEQLISEAGQSEEPSGGGGLMGSLKGAASSMLGGSGAGQGLELMGVLQKTGLSAEQGGSFLTMLIEFIKGEVGEGVVSKITEKLPMLKSLVG